MIDTTEQPLAIVAPAGFGLEAIKLLLRQHRPELHVLDKTELGGQGDDSPLRSDAVVLSRSLLADGQRRIIGYQQLSYTTEEARAVAQDFDVGQDIADALLVITGGWHRYYELCLNAVSQGEPCAANELFGRIRTGPHLDELVQECTSRLSSDEMEVARMACSLGQTAKSLLERIGGAGIVERLQNAGFPLVYAGTGTLKVLSPIDEYLAPPDALDDEAAYALGSVLAEGIGSLQAAQVLLQAGTPSSAASVLQSLSIPEVDEASPELLGATLTTLLDVQKDDGSLNLRLARVHHNAGELALQRSALVASAQAARERLRLDVAVEAEAELLMLDLGHVTDARERHDKLWSEAQKHSNERTLIRLREISEALHIQSDDLTLMTRAVPRLEAIATQWEVIGQPSRAAATLRMLVSTGITHLGRYAYGADLMERACELTKHSPQALLKSLSLRTRMNALAAKVDEYEQLAQRTRELSKSVGLGWLDAYLAWSAMIVAGHRGDTKDVKFLVRKATTLLDGAGLIDHPTGLVFTCEAAKALVQCGELDQAKRLLASVERRASEERLEFELASFLVDCRSSPESGEARSERLYEAAHIPPERQWAVDLEIAAASSGPEAADLLQLARREAENSGLSELFDCLSPSSHSTAVGAPIRICVLGEFQIECGGRPVALTSEKAIQLLAFLAVRGKPVPTEVLVDHLWPEATAQVGARRLRNVIRRARKAVGDEGLLRGSGTLSLGPSVEVDVLMLEDLLDEVERCPDQSSSLVESALALYRGPLLEQMIYDDWVSVHRLGVDKRFVEALVSAVSAQGISPKLARAAARQLEIDDLLLPERAGSLAEHRSQEASLSVTAI